MTPAQFEVRRTLICSTAHITDGVRERFEAQNHLDTSLPLIASFEYGWYLWVPPGDREDAFEEYEQEYGKELADLLRFARKHGFDEIKLDADGDPLEGVPVFEWGKQAVAAEADEVVT